MPNKLASFDDVLIVIPVLLLGVVTLRLLTDKLLLLGKSTVIFPLVVIGLPVIVRLLLVTPTLVTVPPPLPPPPVALIVTAPSPLLGVIDIPLPATILVTPVLVIAIVPLVVIGLPLTDNPVPPVTEILVTVPLPLPFDALITRPYASTSILALEYVPDTDGLIVGKLTLIFPLLTIGLLVTDKVPLVTPTLFTAPPPFPVPVLLITNVPLLPSDPPSVVIVTFSPATNEVTPVLVTTNVEELLLLILIPLPANNDCTCPAEVNNSVKLFCIMLNAVYKLSEFAESFG